MNFCVVKINTLDNETVHELRLKNIFWICLSLLYKLLMNQFAKKASVAGKYYCYAIHSNFKADFSEKITKCNYMEHSANDISSAGKFSPKSTFAI